MAYLTINSTFTPYSFDELIKPFAMYDTAYREQEAYLDAARELDNSGGMFNQESTPIAYGMYSTANDSLKAISDELATNGLSSDLKSRLRNTVRDYRSTMKTLNSAQERYYAEQDRRAKLGSDYVFQQENLSVDDFLGGKSPNQRGESLTDITKDIATQFSARAQQITNDTWNKVLGSNGKVIGGYYDVTTESGLTAAQLDTILSDNDTWQNIMRDPSISDSQKQLLQGFRNTIDAKRNSIGYSDYDDYSRSKIDEAIIMGAHGALGTTTHKYQKDEDYNPLGWANYYLNERQYNDSMLAGETPYKHTNEENPSPANRTGELKEGWSYNSSGKPVYNAGGSSSTGTSYTPSTKGISVHTSSGTRTYNSWDKANEALAEGDVSTEYLFGLIQSNKKAPGFDTMSIQDIKDPELKRALLKRINVPVSNVREGDLDALMLANLDALNQISVMVRGNPGDKNYAWTMEDKTPTRLIQEDENLLYSKEH